MLHIDKIVLSQMTRGVARRACLSSFPSLSRARGCDTFKGLRFLALGNQCISFPLAAGTSALPFTASSLLSSPRGLHLHLPMHSMKRDQTRIGGSVHCWPMTLPSSVSSCSSAMGFLRTTKMSYASTAASLSPFSCLSYGGHVGSSGASRHCGATLRRSAMSECVRMQGAMDFPSTSAPLRMAHRFFFGGKKTGSTQREKAIERVETEEEEGGDGGSGDDPSRGYLPFRAPFHTFNIIMILFLGNILCYLLMRCGDDNVRDFLVEHFTVSRENWFRIYPLFTNAFFQENLLQLLIDCWLLSSVGTSLMSFIGNGRLTWLCLLCVLGGSLFHLAKQQYFLYCGEDDLLVRGRVYGPNTFIMGLISLDGLIFRHLTFIQEPPIPYLVLTAFVMALDVWRICTFMPEEHGAATGGALMALIFWALPIRFFGMDKLTAMM